MCVIKRSKDLVILRSINDVDSCEESNGRVTLLEWL